MDNIKKTPNITTTNIKIIAYQSTNMAISHLRKYIVVFL